MGYYRKDGQMYFTCINQDSNTPTHQFELDFDLSVGMGYEYLAANKNSRSRVFISIEAPKH